MSTYRTQDLYIAALAMALGHAMTGTERQGKKHIFIFEMNEASITNLKTTWLGTGTINARLYADAIRNLKAILHDGDPR